MKKLTISMMLAASFVLAGYSQTTTNSTSGLGEPVDKVLSFLGQGSNWMVAPYGIYDTTTKKYGGGIGVGYKLSDFVVPVMRLDILGNNIYLPSGSMQLQVPVSFNKVTVTPFTFAGIATALGGKGTDNGGVVGIFGAGGAVRISNKFDLIADYERWTGGGFNDNQVRAGFVYKF